MHVRKSAEIRKAEIVDATLHLADVLGPDRLTTGAIAEKVGLTQPGIFRHFPKKKDLWEAVAERIGSLMEARWKAARRGVSSPTDEIRAVIDAQLRLIQSIPAIPAILFSRELHSKNKNLRTAFFGLMGRFQRTIADLVIKARETGAFRADLDADDAAFLVIGLVQGLAVRWSLSGRGFDLAQEGRRLLDLQLAGFGKHPTRNSQGEVST